MILGSFFCYRTRHATRLPDAEPSWNPENAEVAHKIDRLQLPASSRREGESILVRQVSKEIDLTLPWQAGHGRRTAAIALMIGRAVNLAPRELHDLKLAAFLHDIGLLTVPPDMLGDQHVLDSDAYAAIQSHSRIGASLLEPFSFLR